MVDPSHVLRSWNLDADGIALVSARANIHWRVRRGTRAYILRAYSTGRSSDSIGYELVVLRYLHDLGWPVAVPVREVIWNEDRAFALFPALPGSSRLPESSGDMRTRGRTLATIHEALAPLSTRLTQRPGWQRADEVVTSAAWDNVENALERLRNYDPTSAHAIIRHRDRLRESLSDIARTCAQTIVHGDLIAENLLFVGERLTGILDFDSTHLDSPIADVACARRRRHDDVVRGYLEAGTLTESEIGCVADLWRASVLRYALQLLDRYNRWPHAADELAWCARQLEQSQPFAS
jgi:Ser/Thr protein kinase RdoA (MazF antagonist)